MDGSKQTLGVLLLRPEAAAEVLGVGRSKVYELMQTGELPSVAIGRSRRISRQALEQFVAELTGAPMTATTAAMPTIGTPVAR